MPHMITVTIGDDGRLYVEAPGAPLTRIVASPDRRAAAVGQRVAELVGEALGHEPVAVPRGALEPGAERGE